MQIELPPARGTTLVQALGTLTSLACFVTGSALSAADLTKADNITDLGSAGAYTDAGAVPTTADTVIFDDTLIANSSFTWTSNRSVRGIVFRDPAADVTLNLAGALFDFNNSTGQVIDLSLATRNFTITSTSSNAGVRLRGDAVDGATISVGAGGTLKIQTNLFYNNVSNGTTSTIRVTGAGNLTIDGSNGRISDKAVGSGTLTAVSLEGSGTVTFANANTYSGGTSLQSGTLVAGAGGALGNGGVNVSGGELDLNGAGTVAVTLATGQDFVLSAGSVKFDLGTASDQIVGTASGSFNLTGGTIELVLGEGFSYGQVYQLFSGFDIGTSIVSGIAITGYDTLNYQAGLNNLGQLSFSPTSIPEPSAVALITGGVLIAGALCRRSRTNR